MRDKNFSRRRIAESERKFGEAPILGRVSRTPGSAPDIHAKRRRRAKPKAKMNVAVMAWTMLISFGLLVALVVFLGGYFRKKAAQATRDSGYYGAAGDFGAPFSEQKTVELPALSEAEALGIVRTAFAENDPQAMPNHFVLGTDIAPEEALAALARITAEEGEIKVFRWLRQKFSNGRLIGEVATLRETETKTPLSDRIAQLVIGADGKWRIDLDSYLRRVVPDWPTIISRQSPTSVVRIYAQTDNYYNGIYSDETEWQAYMINSPEIDESLYCYARRGTSQEKALRKALQDTIRRLTVEISANPEAAPRQFEITGVLAEDWVLGEKRFDESF